MAALRHPPQHAHARRIQAAAAMNPTAVLADFGSSAAGLSTPEAAARLRTHGGNVVAEHVRPSRFATLWRAVANPLVLLLAVLAGGELAGGDHASAAIMVLLLATGVGLRFFREAQAQTAVESLRTLIRIHATVMRDGVLHDLPLESLVPGDLVLRGYLAFLDPPKDSAAEALTALAADGVQVTVLTGDNELVTAKICLDVGLPMGVVLTRTAIERMTDDALAAAAASSCSWGRSVRSSTSRVRGALVRVRGHHAGRDRGRDLAHAVSLGTAAGVRPAAGRLLAVPRGHRRGLPDVRLRRETLASPPRLDRMSQPATV